MATFRDLLSAAKSQITEVTPAEAEAQIAAGETLPLSVRLFDAAGRCTFMPSQ
mgnify:CR=1 FL=1